MILDSPVQINVGSSYLDGDLHIPTSARGLVLFAHGSGSGRHSPRNQMVANDLVQAGFGTLLMDLLTMQEEEVDRWTREHRFNIPMLADRLVGAIDWLGSRDDTRTLNIGLFGASTGAGAALIAAAQRPEQVKAVVSRGGRPDLAGEYLRQVRAATLLIVGGYDAPVIDLNQQAYNDLTAEKKLEIVPAATHLFEEPGKLEAVSALAAQWFDWYLNPDANRHQSD